MTIGFETLCGMPTKNEYSVHDLAASSQNGVRVKL